MKMNPFPTCSICEIALFQFVVFLQVTHRNDASESEWKKWTWRSQGDLFKRGAFFVESGDPNGVSRFGGLDGTAPRPGKAVKSLTRYAGVIGCRPGVPC